MTFSIGADPEIFVKKNGKAISVYETNLPGTKEEPHKTSRGAVQQDGMAAEFNIDPVPYHDFDAFNQNIVRTVASLRELVGNVTLARDVAVMDFCPDYMATMPNSVKELGCDPDYNAYTLKPNPTPDGEVNFRTASGHVHVGWGADIPTDNEEHIKICADFIKMMDATVGIFMTFIDRDPRRRELYGKAGAFRPKPYGVEYRTPSNVWIWNRDRRLVFHSLVKLSVDLMTRGSTVEGILGVPEERVVEIINSGEHKAALDLLENRIIGVGDAGAQGVFKKIKKEFIRDVE